MKKYDYLVVGAGLTGSIFAYEAKRRGKSVLVIDRNNHIGGNLYTKNIEGIDVHWYGAHIFHTNNKKVWEYMQQFCEFNNYVNSPMAIYKNEIYNLPYNMNTFSKMWGISTPKQAKSIIDQQISQNYTSEPKNLEEQARNLVGVDIYEKLIKGYSEKQWGRKAQDIPAFVIRRIPVRYTYDNNYFNDRFQGIPTGGYTAIFEKLLENIEVRLNVNFNSERTTYDTIANRILYTGPIDEYFDYALGPLEYRSLRFEHEVLDTDNFQGNAVVNYTDRDVAYTRIIEHKHFDFGKQEKTVITREYPTDWEPGMDPYYPINDERNSERYNAYKQSAEKLKHIRFAGRLGMYRYFDMHHIVEHVLEIVEEELGDLHG